MKCPEGWRGEEGKQEQAPCVEIQAGEGEERGVQAGMAKMQWGSAF